MNEPRWSYVRAATIDRDGNVYAAAGIDDENGMTTDFAVWSFAPDGATRWFTVLDEMNARGVAVDGDEIRVVDADGCATLDCSRGTIVRQSDTSCDARIVKCPDETFLVVNDAGITRVRSFESLDRLPVFTRQRLQKPGFFATLAGDEPQRTMSLKGSAATSMSNGDLLVHHEDLVRYTDTGEVAQRVEVAFGAADEMQTVGDDVYIRADGKLWLLHADRVSELAIAPSIDAFAVDPRRGIWVFRSKGTRELVTIHPGSR